MLGPAVKGKKNAIRKGKKYFSPTASILKYEQINEALQSPHNYFAKNLYINFKYPYCRPHPKFTLYWGQLSNGWGVGKRIYGALNTWRNITQLFGGSLS